MSTMATSLRSVPSGECAERLGRHEILLRLGAGGMATVYLARAVAEGGFERLAALKVLHSHLLGEQEFLAMFLDEARVAARIHHPNVVSIQDLGVEHDRMYTVMDYVQGDTLAAAQQAAISFRRGIPMGVVLRVGVDALRGLDAAHRLSDVHGRSLNVVHRDATPHNIIMGLDGISRVADFGIAKAESRISFTGVGTLKGKAPYMAPEQFLGGRVDHRADIYSMAVTLWEALALRRCLPLDLSKPTHRPPYRPLAGLVRNVPRELDAVLARGLRSNPNERWSSAGEFADAIEHHLRDHVAPHRAVATFVRAFARDKIERELNAVRQAEARMRRDAPKTATLRGRSGFQSARGPVLPHLIEHPLPAPDEALGDADSESPTRVNPMKAPRARSPMKGTVLVPAPPARRGAAQPLAPVERPRAPTASLRSPTLVGYVPPTSRSLLPEATDSEAPERTWHTTPSASPGVSDLEMAEPSRVFVSIPAPSIAPGVIDAALLAQPTKLRTVLDPTAPEGDPTGERQDDATPPNVSLSLLRPEIPRAPKVPTLGFCPAPPTRPEPADEPVEIDSSVLCESTGESEAPRAARSETAPDIEPARSVEREAAQSEPLLLPSSSGRIWMVGYAAALATTALALWTMLAR